MGTPLSARVKKHRDLLRSRGLRPIQIWVPNTRKKGFAAECRRQSLLLKNDKREKAVLKWLDKASDREGWK